jgi:hypothetical protein
MAAHLAASGWPESHQTAGLRSPCASPPGGADRITPGFHPRGAERPVAAGLPRHFRGGLTPPYGEVNSPLRFGMARHLARVRSGFPMAIQRGCSDRWRRFRSAGTRSRFLQPVTRHRCKGSPRRVAASKSGDESPPSERQALHPRPQAVISRCRKNRETRCVPTSPPVSAWRWAVGARGGCGEQLPCRLRW